MKSLPLHEITDWLDAELAAPGLADTSHNGLQVTNSGHIRKVCTGVDASSEFFREAQRRGADLLLVHHGISWGDSLKRITELNYQWLKFLLDHDMALYASHLPLDAHPRHGNNAQLCQALGLRALEPFGAYGGGLIGFKGTLKRSLRLETLVERVAELTGHPPQVMPHGKVKVDTVGVISGGAATGIIEAAQQHLDVFLSGEPTLQGCNLAREYAINAIFAGHYATEVFGPRALGEALGKHFPIAVEWIDMGILY